MFGADGAFPRLPRRRRDVTLQKRAEMMLTLEHDVARSLAEAEDAARPERGDPRGVRRRSWAPAATSGRPRGAALPGRLVVDEPGIAHFVERSRMVWQSGDPVWSGDVSGRSQLRAGAADAVRGGFAFPVVAEGRTIGVLAFSGLVRAPDERLLEAARVIGSQFGQFLQRKQAEESLRESEARFRSLTQMSSDFFWETDAAHRFTQLVHGPNGSAQIGRGVIGKRPWSVPSVEPRRGRLGGAHGAARQHLPFRDFEFARSCPTAARATSRSAASRASTPTARSSATAASAATSPRSRSRASASPRSPTTTRSPASPTAPASARRSSRRWSARRRNSSKLAVVFIDLDGFKQINDLHGHDAGDAFLVEVARRLRRTLRASDLVARLGGDEFLVVLEEVQDPAPVESVAKKLLGRDAAALRPLRRRKARVSASIGISIFPDDAADAAALMKHADKAMYAAKQAGKNAYRFFRAERPGAAGRARGGRPTSPLTRSRAVRQGFR